MSFQRFLGTLFFGAVSVGFLGCVAPVDSDGYGDDEEDIEEAAQASDTPQQMIVSMNGMEAGLLTDPNLTPSLAALPSSALDGVVTPLADTADGRTLLAYVGRCALTGSQSAIVRDSSGTPYELRGYIGLAPSWLSQAVGQSAQRWVSACLLAHANAYGIDVTIALRGDHPALSDPPPSGLSEQEAAFYGDVFQDDVMFACVGSSGGGNSTNPPRVCGRTDECRFTIMGTCAQPVFSPICSGSDVYHDCAGEVSPGQLENYAEVITVYTAPGMFGQGHGCTHSPTARGWPLNKTCSSVTAEVCEDDPYCCETDWDEACIAQAQPIVIAIP